MSSDWVERGRVRIAALVLLLAILLAAQSAAAVLAPTGESVQTGRVIGRASFAFVSGIRTFAAAVLWNRLDPQFDLYYAGKSLADQTQMLPAISLVQTLDPQFVQAYYVASWIVARHGDTGEGMRICREGIENNPRSGLLRSNYIENMLLVDNARAASGMPRLYVSAAVAQADAALRSDTVWSDDAEKVEGYMVMSAAYRLAGIIARADLVKAAAAELAESSGVTGTGGAGHDHDGDGTPDH